MMNQLRSLVPLVCAVGVSAFFAFAQEKKPEAAVDAGNEEAFLKNTRQLTFAGRRAGEGYFNADGTKLIFQSEREEGNPFYQIYLMDLETGDTNRVSPGHGKTTCAWIHPSDEKVLFASSHADAEAKAKQEAEYKERAEATTRKYSWDYDENYDIWESKPDGAGLVNLTNVKGYDAEGSYSPDGEWIAFASNRHAYAEQLSEADAERFKIDKSLMMEIYLMRADGSEVKRLTDVKGYDGGPFFSADGKRICWRRFTEKGDQAEIWTMNVDGSDPRQLTRLGAMSWAPYFHPSGEYLIFATNLNGFGNFELYLVDAAGKKEPVRVTTTDGFDGLPVFTPDGKSLSWTSNRTAKKQSQIFIADWNHDLALEKLGVSGGAAVADVEVPDVATEASINEADIKAHIDYLASPELKGRLTGTEGEVKATAYVAKALAQYGLEPAGEDGTFYDGFDFTAGVDLGASNSLAIKSGEETIAAVAGEDWKPLSFSKAGEIPEGGVVFAGYGLDIPEAVDSDGKKADLYTSFAHLDVKGKWIMVFRYMPEGLDDAQRQRFSRHASLRFKAMVARQKWAKGIIVVSGPNAKVKNQLVPLAFDASMAGSGVPAISVTDAFAEKLLASSGKKLKALQDRLDTGNMMGGFELPGVTVGGNIEIKHERRVGRNVIGRLASGNPEAAPLVIGAHVDHLGERAGPGSLARDDEKAKIHFGADDNASGIAGLLEIAEYLADMKKRGKFAAKRDILFAAWSGEEIGLLGSNHYVANFAGPNGDSGAPLTGKIAACLNMDMIGRLDKALVLQGVASSDYWAAEIERRNAPVGLPLQLQDDCYIPTDATSFYLKGIPILSAFTGAHSDYHTPRDTPDKINLEGAKKTARLMGLIARGVALSDEIPVYKAVERPENQNNRAKLRVYLGTIPDYAQGDENGVKLSGVTKGAPAETAGIKAGDLIIKLAGKDVKNIYDYTYVMGAMKIGRETEVVVLRKGKAVKLTIVPGSRE